MPRFSRMNLLASGFVFVVAGAFHLSQVRGDQRADAIAKLLDVGWAVTPQARSAADLQFAELQKLVGTDPQALAASWLVLMQQRRFDEALKRLDEYLGDAPDDLAALRAKAWLQTVLKNYPAAFPTADRLSLLLTKHEPKDDEAHALHNESIAFLGRLLGFFGGPASEAVNQDERKALEKRLLGRLPESQRPLFDDARNSVLAKYIEMADVSADTRERAAAASNAEKERTLAELQIDKEKLDARAKELDDRKDKLNSEFRAELDSIAKQEQPLVQQQAQLVSRADILNNDLLNFNAQLLTLQQLINQEKNQNLRQQYLNQLNSLGFLASRVEADLLGVNRLLRGVQSQRAGLQARRAQAQTSTAAQIDRVDRELADLGKRERRNEGMEKRAQRASVPSTSRLRSLSAQATALSTYDAFPLEAAKAKLLESLR